MSSTSAQQLQQKSWGLNLQYVHEKGGLLGNNLKLLLIQITEILTEYSFMNGKLSVKFKYIVIRSVTEAMGESEVT